MLAQLRVGYTYRLWGGKAGIETREGVRPLAHVRASRSATRDSPDSKIDVY